MKKNIKKVIFIGSSSFSGSTMLDMMLSNSQNGFSVGEVYALFRPFRPHHFKPDCGCGNPDCDFWTKVRSAGENHLYQSIFSLLPEISFIVDSSKDPWWIQKQSQILQQQGFEVHHVLMWKEPAAFAHSMLKRGKRGWGKSWKDYYRLYITLIGNFQAISYDELAQQPSDTLLKLCREMGLMYHSGQEHFWEKHHHTLFGNDSAKIHLHDDSSENYLHCKKELTPQDNPPEHRSIYYDRSYLNSLPTSVKLVIQTDPVFHSILTLFNSDDALSTEKQGISLSPVQTFFVRICWRIRAIIGRILGRYWFLF